MSFFFSFIRSDNWRAEQVLPEGLVPVERGRRWRKGERVWKWCKHRVHIYVNGKMIPIDTIPGMGSEIKENIILNINKHFHMSCRHSMSTFLKYEIFTHDLLRIRCVNLWFWFWILCTYYKYKIPLSCLKWDPVSRLPLPELRQGMPDISIAGSADLTMNRLNDYNVSFMTCLPIISCYKLRERGWRHISSGRASASKHGPWAQTPVNIGVCVCIHMYKVFHRIKPVILSTWEAKIGRITAWGQNRQNVPDTLFQKIAGCGGIKQSSQLWWEV
jgi:hypothetical protein